MENLESQWKIETAIREAVFGVRIDHVDIRITGTRGMKPSDYAKSPKDSSQKLLYKEMEPIMSEANHQTSQKKKQQHQLIQSDENPKEREMITASFPQSAHGVIIIKDSDDSKTMKWGSGVMIGPDLVLTAAHNVYDNQKPSRKRYPCIKFIPGANGDVAPFGEIDVEEVFAPEKYINHQGDEENYALMILKTPIGRQTGYCWLRAVSAEYVNELLKDKVVSLVGYPAVESMKEKSEICFEQWRERGIIQKIEEKTGFIHYDVKAGPSQGGGCVFYENLIKYERNVIGVHVGQEKDSGLACMITTDRFEELLQWIHAYELKKKKFKEIIQSKDDKEGVIKKLLLSGKHLGAELNLLAEYRLSGLEEIDLSGNGDMDEGIEILCKHTFWEHLQSIDLRRCGIGNNGCTSLSKNETWKQLKALFLGGNAISDKGVAAIVKSKNFLGLEELGLNYNQIGECGALVLADNNLTWNNLKRLDLGYNMIGDEGAAAIGINTHWKNLEALTLSRNKISAQGAFYIGSNTTWEGLKELRLNSNEIGDKGAIAIANNKIWTKLQRLNLNRNCITDEGGEAIGKNAVWKFLEVLDLSQNEIEDQGALAIGLNSAWSNLKELYLNHNQIGAEGGAAIGRNTTWKDLEVLFIGYNRIGDEGALSIGSNRTWTKLQDLMLEGNQIGNEGATVLGSNPTWKRLETLDLQANEIGYQGQVALVRNPVWRYIKTMILSHYRRPTQERINALNMIALINPKRIENYLPTPVDLLDEL